MYGAFLRRARASGGHYIFWVERVGRDLDQRNEIKSKGSSDQDHKEKSRNNYRKREEANETKELYLRVATTKKYREEEETKSFLSKDSVSSFRSRP